jgi:DNA polymerase-1
MSETLYLVDGMSFAFRSYYAIKAALTDSKGRPTNAVYGFTRILLKLLREHNPSHIAVVFDFPGKTFRDELYQDYKATRRETPEALRIQFPMMHELVQALNISLLCVEGVEADDVMGTLAKHAEAEGIDTVLVTGDKDMLQLLNDRVKVFDPSKGDNGLWYTDVEVKERFGVGPDHVVDALALIGDAADNVPGVRGIGDKTAKKLLEKYGNLENLYKYIHDQKGKQKERLIEDKEQAFFSRQLVTIKTDVEIDVSVRDCSRREWEPQTVIDMLNGLSFHSLVDEMLADVALPQEKLDYRLVLTEAALKQAIAEMRAAGEFAIDTETTDTDPMRCCLVGVSMSAKDQTGYYIPVGHTAQAMATEHCGEQKPDPALTRDRILELLRPLLEDPALGKIGHNIKYDLIAFARAGISLRGITLDTMVASYLTDPSRLRHNLNEVSLQYLRRKLIPISDLIGKGSKAITFDHVPVDRACEYAAEDADISYRLAEVFRPHLKERQLEALYDQVERPLIEVLARMEMAGIRLDTQKFEELRGEIEARLGTLEHEIFELAGERFTINSPKQLQVILFEKLGLKPLRRTKTGYSTDVDVLEQLAQEHRLPEKLLEYRMLEKLRGTYVEALPKLLHPETGRVHTSYNQAVAATGRLSSSDPNLQNIPVRSDIGRRIREGFVPEGPEWRLISADYSQIELRILAHLSGDKNLKQAFAEDRDIHSDTAARVFGVELDLVTPEMRRQAKAVNFGVVYGISAFGLAKGLGISTAEAGHFIESYFKQYPKVRDWLDATLERAKVDGYVTTLLHRRRYLPELNSSDVNTRRGAERAAINMPVQGTAADVIKLAMVRLDEALQGSETRLLLQVHDELVVEVREERAAETAAQMKEIMEGALPLTVPLKVDVGIGMNWAEIH